MTSHREISYQRIAWPSKYGMRELKLSIHGSWSAWNDETETLISLPFWPQRISEPIIFWGSLNKPHQQENPQKRLTTARTTRSAPPNLIMSQVGTGMCVLSWIKAKGLQNIIFTHVFCPAREGEMFSRNFPGGSFSWFLKKGIRGNTIQLKNFHPQKINIKPPSLDLPTLLAKLESYFTYLPDWGCLFQRELPKLGGWKKLRVFRSR